MLSAERAHEGRHLFPNQQAENKQVSEVGLGSQPTEAKGPDPKVNTFQAARPVSQPWQDPTAGLRDAVVLNRGPIAARIAAPRGQTHLPRRGPAGRRGQPPVCGLCHSKLATTALRNSLPTGASRLEALGSQTCFGQRLFYLNIECEGSRQELRSLIPSPPSSPSAAHTLPPVLCA